jgi:hypothetical protein
MIERQAVRIFLRVGAATALLLCVASFDKGCRKIYPRDETSPIVVHGGSPKSHRHHSRLADATGVFVEAWDGNKISCPTNHLPCKLGISKPITQIVLNHLNTSGAHACPLQLPQGLEQIDIRASSDGQPGLTFKVKDGRVLIDGLAPGDDYDQKNSDLAGGQLIYNGTRGGPESIDVTSGDHVCSYVCLSSNCTVSLQ